MDTIRAALQIGEVIIASQPCFRASSITSSESVAITHTIQPWRRERCFHNPLQHWFAAMSRTPCV